MLNSYGTVPRPYPLPVSVVSDWILGLIIVGIGWMLLKIQPGNSQAMGAFSTSTGSLAIPTGITSVSRTTPGPRGMNVMNQPTGTSGGFVVPTYSFVLPDLPKPTQPEQPLRQAKPFEPSLGIFESNH